MEKQMLSRHTKNKKRNLLGASILAIGIVALTQGGVNTAQAEEITSVSSANCSTTEGYTVTLTGNFGQTIYNVWANDYQVPLTDWTQTTTSVVAKIPASTVKTFSFKIYNGGTILEKDFTCTDSVVAVPVDEDPVVTEDGGTIPSTATNNYNSLAAGLGLVGIGGTVLYRRRLITE
jgi:LPXTG-motif cell wall-anchored protein